MPKSRSKRSNYTSPMPKKPAASPRWVPYLGLGLIGLGILLVLVQYFVPGLPGGNLNLIFGFIAMAGGLLVLSTWR
ncbi:MAG: cell division protein CrgA [Egibacteraceae bacterium]